MALSKDFLWGGALAANQFEGGVLNTSKGYSVADVMTAGAHVYHVLLLMELLKETIILIM